MEYFFLILSMIIAVVVAIYVWTQAVSSLKRQHRNTHNESHHTHIHYLNTTITNRNILNTKVRGSVRMNQGYIKDKNDIKVDTDEIIFP